MRPIDDLREKIDLWKKSTTDTSLMSVLYDVLKQIDVAIYEMDHHEAESPWRNRRMSDLIYRGDVLGVISCFFKDNDIDGLADLEREINRLDAASPWHSMEDNGPPEENGPYFVYAPSYRGGSSSEKERARGVMISKWTGKHWSIEVGYYKRPGCVTHWMPIEPPKEDA